MAGIRSEADPGQDLGGEGWENEDSQRRETLNSQRMPKDVEMGSEWIDHTCKIQEQLKETLAKVSTNGYLWPRWLKKRTGT